MSNATGYLKASQHPWPCFLLVLPLLLLYEAAVFSLGGAHQEPLRNGADLWVRYGLQKVGLKWFWVPPALLILSFLIWIGRRLGDKPGDLIGVLSGMAIESVLFALGLWGLSRALAPLMQTLGLQLSVEADPALKQLVPRLGAGIYEEMIFRLLLFSFLFGVVRKLEVGVGLACVLAAVGSATLFSAAHHIGKFGEDYRNYVFLFRVIAGVYFALIYHYRGIGIAVGTHSCYNIMVSIGSS